MSTVHDSRVHDLFVGALRVERGERSRYLDAACAGDAALRSEVGELLAHHDRAEGFLEPKHLPPDIGEASVVTVQRIGRYRILGLLGAGGMGAVYRAEQESPRRQVALKVIRSGVVTRQMLRRFEHEAQVLGMLQHPGIAQIYEAGAADTGAGEQPFFAMELVEGVSITTFARDRALNVRARLGLFVLVCDAVQHAHEKGVVHRDLKPSNILVDEAARPRIVDFGVARFTREAGASLGTLAGQVIGTIPYMSPEQVAGRVEAVDTRSDVYSLGVLLYELLTGKLPHGLGECSLPEAARLIQEADPTRLGAVNRALRGDIETIVSKAMEKESARRYASAAELAADVRRFLDGLPIVARHDSAMYVLGRRLRRYRGMVVGVSVFTAVTAALALYTGVLAYREADAKERALGALKEADTQRTRADAAAEDLRRELSDANIERGRSMGRAGNLSMAEELLWREALKSPSSPRARWALIELAIHNPCVLRMEGHTRNVRDVTMSPDGALMVTTGMDNTVRMWRADTGEQLWSHKPHARYANTAVFMPDGASVVTGGTDQKCLLLDASTGATLREIGAHPMGISAAFPMNGGARIATIAGDGLVRLHDAQTGEVERTLAPTGTELWCGAVDRAERRIAAGDRHGSVWVWDVDTGEVQLALRAHASFVNSVAFSPDGARLATGGQDWTVSVWDVDTGARVTQLAPDEGGFWSVRFSPDGSRLAAGADWNLVVWNTAGWTREKLPAGQLRGVTALQFSHDGRRVATASDSGLVRVWETGGGAQPRELLGHQGEARVLVSSADGRLLAAGDEYGGVTVWRRDDWAVVSRFEVGSRLNTLAFTPDGAVIAAGSRAFDVTLWRVADGARVGELSGHQGAVNRVVFSRDGRRAFTVAEDQALRWWDVETRTCTREVNPRSRDAVDLAVSEPAGRIVTAHGNGRCMIWSLETGERVHEWLAKAPVYALAIAPQRGLLASGDFDGRIGVRRVVDGALLGVMHEHHKRLRNLVFSADESVLVSTGYDGLIHVWDTESHACLATLEPGRGPVLDVAISPKADMLAAASRDGSVLVWDLARTRALVLAEADRQAARLGKSLGEEMDAQGLEKWKRE